MISLDEYQYESVKYSSIPSKINLQNNTFKIKFASIDQCLTNICYQNLSNINWYLINTEKPILDYI